MGASPPSVHLSDVNVTQRVFRVHMDAHVEKYVLTLITCPCGGGLNKIVHPMGRGISIVHFQYIITGCINQ